MFERIFKNIVLTEDEANIIKWAESDQTRVISQSKVIAQIYSIKKLEILFDNLIESNKKLSNSNSKHSRALNWLTGALVFVGIVQIIANIFFN